jgi:hypothetical protein
MKVLKLNRASITEDFAKTPSKWLHLLGGATGIVIGTRGAYRCES